MGKFLKGLARWEAAGSVNECQFAVKCHTSVTFILHFLSVFLFAVLGPGRALMSLTVLMWKCCRLWHNRSPQYKRPNNKEWELDLLEIHTLVFTVLSAEYLSCTSTVHKDSLALFFYSTAFKEHRCCHALIIWDVSHICLNQLHCGQWL